VVTTLETKTRSNVVAVAFNAQGQQIAVVDDSKALQVVNLDTGEAFAPTKHPLVRIPKWSFSALNRILRLSRDGKYLVFLDKPGTQPAVQVVDLQTRSVVFTAPVPGPCQCAALAEEARRIAVGQRQHILVYDPWDGRLIATLKGHEDDLADLTFDRSGQVLASVAYDGTVRLWDPATGELFVTFHTGQKTFSRVSLSPTGRWLATGDTQGQVRLWDLAEVRRHLQEAGLDWSAPPIAAAP
jgi:WD40 repeat protein